MNVSRDFDSRVASAVRAQNAASKPIWRTVQRQWNLVLEFERDKQKMAPLWLEGSKNISVYAKFDRFIENYKYL